MFKRLIHGDISRVTIISMTATFAGLFLKEYYTLSRAQKA